MAALPPPSQTSPSRLRSLGAQTYTLAALNSRRVAHSLKVGLALSIVSLTVLLEEFFDKLGNNAIWAVMTVVVVFELTAGATLCKGSNRAFGTLLAGTVALGVEYLADLAGPGGEPYVMGISVFIVGTLATFARFCEPFKSKYDYGVMIFLLTFSLVIVSGYRVTDSIVSIALSRFLMIALGAVVCLIVSLLVWPIWAGEDIHNITFRNFESLGGCLEDCVRAYFERTTCSEQACEEDSIYDRYKALLLLTSSEESLANFASWEPRCGRGFSKDAWMQYVKVGGMLRNCTYSVASLHGCLKSDVQAPFSLRDAFSKPCLSIALESAKLLRELGENIKRREKSRLKAELMGILLEEVERLKKYINAYPHLFVHLLNGAMETDLADDVKLMKIEKPIIRNTSLKQKKTIQQAADGESCYSELRCCAEADACKMVHGDEKDPEEEAATPAAGMGVITRSSEQFTEFLPIATVAFLLMELVPRMEHLVEAVKTLEELSGFSSSIWKRQPLITVSATNSCYDSLSIQMTE